MKLSLWFLLAIQLLVGAVTALIMIMVFMAAAMLFSACTAHAAPRPGPDLALLRDVICGYETEGSAIPALAINGTDRGNCQVQEETAARLAPYAVAREHVPAWMTGAARDWLHGNKAAFQSLLHLPSISRGFALAYLERSRDQWGRRTLFKLAFSYNRGRARITKNDSGYLYALAVQDKYHGAEMRAQRVGVR